MKKGSETNRRLPSWLYLMQVARKMKVVDKTEQKTMYQVKSEFAIFCLSLHHIANITH